MGLSIGTTEWRIANAGIPKTRLVRSAKLPRPNPEITVPTMAALPTGRPPKTEVTIASDAAQPQFGNFPLIAATSGKMPMTVKNDATRSAYARAPATGLVTMSKPTSTPRMPPTKCRKNPPHLHTRNA